MSDLAPSPADSDAASGPTAISRPSNPTETAPQPDPAQTYPPRVETAAPDPAEASPAAGNASARTATQSPSPRHFTRIWRRAWLQTLAVLGAAIIGIAFGHVVAGNDYRMQVFFSATVGMGLFIVFSGLATEVHRNRRRRSR
jgi:hypothetical protein